MPSSLTVDSQSFDIAGAWHHNRSLRRLRSSIRTRGNNRLIPNVDGQIGYPVRRDESVVDMELMVFGLKDQTGTPHADSMSGLDENLAYLEDWVHDHLDGSTAAWPAVLVTTSGRTFEADVQILNWQVMADNGPQVVIGYDLRIPAGIWTETTP